MIVDVFLSFVELMLYVLVIVDKSNGYLLMLNDMMEIDGIREMVDINVFERSKMNGFLRIENKVEIIFLIICFFLGKKCE